MQIPEVLLRQSVIIEILNMIGLGGLGIGIVILYRALVSRSKLLSEGLDDIKKAYQSVLELMDKRAMLIDKRFEDEKCFRSLYLSFFQDSDVHIKRLQSWKENEVTHLQAEVERLSGQSKKVEEDLKKTIAENLELEEELKKVKEEVQLLKLQNQELTPPRPPNVRGLH